VRKSAVFFGVIAIHVAIVFALAAHAVSVKKASWPHMEQMSLIVSDFALTDLCLFTEARYTRHPSMADFTTPFQDYPFSLEHFPSGSLMPVPVTIRK
jgi:hypothetical protein